MDLVAYPSMKESLAVIWVLQSILVILLANKEKIPRVEKVRFLRRISMARIKNFINL